MGWDITLVPSGLRWPADPAQTVLMSAQSAGIELPSSCRNGTCRTCLSRLRSGQIDYLVEWPGVSTEEKEAGYFLPCVARPRSDLEIEAVPVPAAGLL
jgi:ferredoxin